MRTFMGETMHTLSQILKFVKDQTGADEVLENSDINRDLGCDGDDFDELISKFAREYNVDTSSCLWYFHCTEEANIIWSISNSPDKYVTHIPVTPLMLLEFAQKGKWDLQYPEHTVPTRRYIFIPMLLLAASLLTFAIYQLFFR
ncbi:DUF1493 family protein [Chitinophaga agrisoli]|nr:DUF1493 family protein [Chitinophaga agrisoli]